MTATDFRKLERQLIKLSPKQKEKLRRKLWEETEDETERRVESAIRWVEAGKPLVRFSVEEFEAYSKALLKK